MILIFYIKYNFSGLEVGFALFRAIK